MLRRDKVSSIPEENRVLFTSHDTFGYFAERYNFEVDTALASVSTEALASGGAKFVERLPSARLGE